MAEAAQSSSLGTYVLACQSRSVLGSFVAYGGALLNREVYLWAEILLRFPQPTSLITGWQGCNGFTGYSPKITDSFEN
jgi:hypothetical protein